MSVSSYQSTVASLQKDIGDLRSRIADENQRIARVNGDIASLMRSMDSASSINSKTSYLNQIQSKQSDGARIEKNVADLERRMGDKQRDLGRAQENLASAQKQEHRQQQQEADKRDSETKRRTEEQLRRSREQTREYQHQAALQSHMRREALRDLNRLPEKIKVLFCAADPKNEDRLALDEEVRVITAQIRASKHRDSVDLISIWAVRSSDLLQALNEHEPHVVHFSGHGSDQDDIIFLDSEGNSKFVSKTAIVQMLASAAANLRLVVFNTCFSFNQAEEITEHVEAAIGMSDSIGDEAARNFSAQFYSAIGFGLSVQQAFDQAKALLLAENSKHADIPTLFTKADADAKNIVLVKP